MSKLLIVESHGKIEKISEYLGDDFIVMASFGHIIDLNEKKLSVNLETFEPEYVQYKDKVSIIEKMCKQINKIGKSNVFLAADEDREGEMIAWSLARELKLTNPKRIVFNSITKKELKKAIEKVQQIDLNMVKAQQARRILDRLAGYIISPILYKSTKGGQSAGRVQSVVVKIVVDKEKEIEKFFSGKTETYFTVGSEIIMGDYEINTKLYNKTEILELTVVNTNYSDVQTSEDIEISEENNQDTKVKTKGKSKTKSKTDNQIINTKSPVIFNKTQEPEVVEIIKNMIKAEYKLLKMTEKIRKSNPPAPYTTSTLQQTASQRLGMDAKRTMNVAQKLYEGGHITYMRTDSMALSEEAMDTIKEHIVKSYGNEYYEKRIYANKKANTQEAHECIRPTKIYSETIEGTNDEKRLYSLIWKRTIQSQMKASEYQNIIVEIEMLKKKILSDYKLVGNLENLIFVGYQIVDGKKPLKSMSIDTLKKLLIEWKEIIGLEDTQKPPSRYNDASLINKMDPKNLNIGRPSTYAPTIEKIISRKYVEIKDIQGKNLELKNYHVNKSEPKVLNLDTKKVSLGKENKKLVPTELGIQTTDFLEKHFSQLMDYSFTANMEKQLDDIAEGKLDKLKLIKPFYDYIQSQIKKIVFTKNESGLGNNYVKPQTIGSHNSTDIILCDGPYGKYVLYGKSKFNLKILLGKQNKVQDLEDLEADLADLEADLEDLENQEINKKSNSKNEEITNELIVEKLIEKLNEAKNNTNTEWTKGKQKYILKKGMYGYYIEHWTGDKKKNNCNANYLIKKIAKINNLNEQDETNIPLICEIIKVSDIEELIDYNKKKLKK